MGHHKNAKLRRIGMEEGERIEFKGTENFINKIIEENVHNLKKDMCMKIQEAYRTPNRLDQKKIPLPHNNQKTKHTE